ncbi:MAG: creatininase family protein [Spirosomaceae bacterium]|nr:creatininase family protein [Spirosomataceae bacterium]
MRPYILAETNWQAVKETEFQLAVLPWGATEAHNYHLPYATDNIEADALTSEAARMAWEAGHYVVVLPTVPFGVNTGQADIPLCLNLYPSTQMAILCDIAEVLVRSGINKLLIFNSHGGNDFKQMVREVGAKFPQLWISTCFWFKALDGADYFEYPGDHADETETSLLLHIRPDLVLPLDEAGDGHAKKIKISAMQEGWAWAERRWTQVTDDTGVGYPKKATAAKGERFFQDLTTKISELFIELCEADLEDLYE